MSRKRRSGGRSTNPEGVYLSADNTFFTSDLHFFHSNIIEYSNRPWRHRGGAPDVEGMTEGLIGNWNSVVKDGDSVFILGDLAMGGRSKADLLATILSRLKGNKFLIPGNHDTYVLDSENCLQHITILPPLTEIKVSDPEHPRGRQRITMCHYAMKVWNKSHHGAWQLYGHSHHSMKPDYTIKSLEVGVDGPGYDYKPLSYHQVKNLMSAHGSEPVDHHNSRTNDGY